LSLYTNLITYLAVKHFTVDCLVSFIFDIKAVSYYY